MSQHLITATLIVIVVLSHPGCAARLLGVFPIPSLSHQIVFRGLTLALRERGHELVVVTPNPINGQTLKNYTEIDDIRWPAVLLLAKRSKIPAKGITSLYPHHQLHHQLGNPIMPSHPSYWTSKGTAVGKLTFWQRLYNFVATWRYLYHYRTTYMQKQQEIARRYFGNDVPDLGDLEKNFSLVFVNQQAPISFIPPNVPKIIDIGGFHISDQRKPLSKDLQRILYEATQGFIYMSLGTNAKSASLTNKTRDEFMAAFSKIPYTVIWKFDNEFIPGQPDNVHIMKWIPQQSVLAHPNLKVFIYQGGLQSTEEAVSHAVPVIGLPVFCDQESNVDKIVSLGVGKKLDIFSVDRFGLMEAIHSIVRDDSYKRSMLKLRDLIRDPPYDLMKNAVWWTEHVIRHKGAPHLHSTTADDPWYQRHDMDLIFSISAGFLTTLGSILVVLYKLLLYSTRVIKYQIPASKKDKVH